MLFFLIMQAALEIEHFKKMDKITEVRRSSVPQSLSFQEILNSFISQTHDFLDSI